MKKWTIKTYFRLFLWAALLLLPILYFVGDGMDFRRLDWNQHQIQNLLTYAGLLLFSYFNHTVFVPKWYLARRYVRYGAVVLGCIFLVAWLPHRVEQWVFLRRPPEPTVIGWMGQLFWRENMSPDRSRPDLTPGPHDRRGSPPRNRSRGLPSIPLPYKFGIILLLAGLGSMASVTWHTSRRLQRIETEKLSAELVNLRAQIHPHFLFNTLNSIYALAVCQDERTAGTIVKLSEFMRYLIQDVQEEMAPLGRELNYLNNYIDLQRMRLREAVRIDYTLEGAAGPQQIAPLILFSFVENAFKHGVNPDEVSEIAIKINIQEERLALSVVNTKVSAHTLDDSTGVGQQNTIERLKRLYPERHELTIEDGTTHYSVQLTLLLA